MIETDKELNMLFLSIWEQGYREDNTMSWKQRLRYMWQILIKGKPYGDQIVLDRESCLILSKFLTEYASHE